MAPESDQAKEKLAEYLRLAAAGSKTEEEIKRDASDIVETTMMGAIEMKEEKDRDNQRRGGSRF